MHCSACNQDVAPVPPKREFWTLIAAFWVFSLLFGIGAALGSGWEASMIIAWLLLATTTGVIVQRATAWTCSECGATIREPLKAPA